MLLTDRQTHTHTHTDGRTGTQSDRNKPLAGFNDASIEMARALGCYSASGLECLLLKTFYTTMESKRDSIQRTTFAFCTDNGKCQ